MTMNENPNHSADTVGSSALVRHCEDPERLMAYSVLVMSILVLIANLLVARLVLSQDRALQSTPTQKETVTK